MAYRHYETIGLVLASRSLGEANRLYQVFTPDFGLLRVLAQGIRLEKSKLRYQLQDQTLVNLNLVRGREYWRLVGVTKVGLANQNQIIFLRKISLILLRLIPQEEVNTKIFSDLKQAWDLLEIKEGSDDVEIFIMTRVLAELGYLAKNSETESILNPMIFSWSDIENVTSKRKDLIKLINSALLTSGL